MRSSKLSAHRIVSNSSLLLLLMVPVATQELGGDNTMLLWVLVACVIWIAYRAYEITKGRGTGTMAS